ncbi:MAG: C39 family peptidase [Deltaproteobacteria bacterium]|nr:C39 family peptidase [Deltaproteobacteria bacterium]
MVRINFENFPKIKQSTQIWCIPASVENVVKYHGGDISQVDIVIEFIQKFTYFKSICFEKVKDILDERYGKNFEFIVKSLSNGDFKTGNDVISYAEDCIKKGLPLIVSMKPFKSRGAHMYTIIGLDDDIVVVFDTNPDVKGYTRMPKDKFIRDLSSDMGTLLIKPKS